MGGRAATSDFGSTSKTYLYARAVSTVISGINNKRLSLLVVFLFLLLQQENAKEEQP